MPLPEVVPFWRSGIAEPNQGNEGADEALLSKKQKNFSNINPNYDSTLKQWLKKVDGFSAAISCGFFILTIWLLWNKNPLVTLSKEKMVFVQQNHTIFHHYSNYMTQLTSSPLHLQDSAQESCTNGWNSSHICRNFTEQKEAFYSFPVTVQSSRTVSLKAPILYILAFSSIIQASRYFLNSSSDPYLESFHLDYNPIKPDFWRWFEYACTSPFQVFLIGISLSIFNEFLLFLLFGLQFALMWFGFMLEKRINKFYKSTKMKIGKKFKLLCLLFCAWLCFTIIWVVFINQFNAVKQNFNTCDAHIQKFPTEVTMLVWGQFFSFLMFGVVQTWQVIDAFLHAGKPRAEEDKQFYWLLVTMCYSVLSVFSKCYLDITLIYYINMYSDIQCKNPWYLPKAEHA